jgi:putative N-acetyltransferase (TIGR04045 family)
VTVVLGLDGAPLASRPGIGPPVDRAGLAGPADAGARFVGRRAGPGDAAAHARLRRAVFVDEQGLFARSDTDDVDGDPHTVVLVAADGDGAVVGGVRLAPGPGGPDGGWWRGSRLVVRADRRRDGTVGAALVRAACAVAEEAGALRFDAVVQPAAEAFFARLGWRATGSTVVAGRTHVAMSWPVNRVARLVAATKEPLAGLLDGLAPGGVGWVGDDAAPVPGADLVAACDAITPSMVERDPEWAGWCGVLVNVNDLGAMGATPVALLDALAAPTRRAAARVIAGLRRASEAWAVPIIGGHTQIGAPAALAVTAIGRTGAPVPGGGGRPGDDVYLTADLVGRWRPGYAGAQWDSTTSRSAAELRALTGTVARLDPAAAKDVSMAGIVGTLGMLAEASGCGAELEVARVPRPAGASVGDWVTCFPGFAVLTADRPGRRSPTADDTRPGDRGSGDRGSPAAHARCGRLVPGSGVMLVWPDGTRTTAVAGAVTGLGAAAGRP